MKMILKLYAVILALCLILPAIICAQENEKMVEVSVEGNIFKPSQTEAADSRVASLKLPAGFKIRKFAEGMGNVRIMAMGSDGTLYITRNMEGDLISLKDNDGDGKSDVMQVLFTKEGLHGLCIYGNKMYLTTVKEVYSADINPDGTITTPVMIINDLPDGGQHPRPTLAVGPDNRLYISIGSSCNECVESNPEKATMLVANLDGSNRKIYAKGLRNTIGFGWHPATGEMWGMDQGIDWLGDRVQGEELNMLVENANYGWPHIYEDGKFNLKTPPKDMTMEEFAKTVTSPVMLYDAHASPIQMVFYTGTQFPEEYRNDAFVCFRGSWNRAEPSGYNISRIHFEGGKPVRFENFVSSFLTDDNKSYFGRVAGITQGNDGSLYFCDDSNGVVYKVMYSK